MVVTGNMVAHNFLHLYKTDLQVKDTSSMSLTYNKVSKNDASQMQLGLIFKSNPDEVVYLPIENSGRKTNGWKTVTVDLSQYAGEEIAAIGLGFNPRQGEIKNYQMNIGEMKFTDGTSYTPSAPENFRITKAFDTGDMIVKWDMADYSDVTEYHIYANFSDGSRKFMGGLYGDTFYIKSLYGEDEKVTLELQRSRKRRKRKRCGYSRLQL